MNELILIAGLVIIIFFLLITRVSSKMNTLETRVKGLQFRLEQVAKAVNVPEHPVNDTLRELIKEGKDIEAVKAAREALGLSLLEAKEYVDVLKVTPSAR